MKNTILTIASLSLLLFSCNSEQETKTNKITEVPEVQFENKGHKLVYNMVQKVGNYKSLTDKKNVSYTYRYTTADNQSDISTERYIFNGELSYGNYKKHERTLSQFEGAIEQGYDGSEFWLKHNGEIVEDAETLKRVKFNRPTNFYWFTMMQKLLDPGLNYEFIEETKIDNQDYDVVKVTFDSEDGRQSRRLSYSC